MIVSFLGHGKLFDVYLIFKKSNRLNFISRSLVWTPAEKIVYNCITRESPVFQWYWSDFVEIWPNTTKLCITILAAADNRGSSHNPWPGTRRVGALWSWRRAMWTPRTVKHWDQPLETKHPFWDGPISYYIRSKKHSISGFLYVFACLVMNKIYRTIRYHMYSIFDLHCNVMIDVLGKVSNFFKQHLPRMGAPIINLLIASDPDGRQIHELSLSWGFTIPATTKVIWHIDFQTINS